jgi:hypothetical protein
LAVRVTLPIPDPTPDEANAPSVERVYEPGASSITQGIIEKVMLQDFPEVAALGIEGYVHRLSRMVYTNGFQVFWLDRLPDLPGYTLCALEPPTTGVNTMGALALSISYLTGPKAAHRAEQVRRWIPPGEVHN